ncbi:unnamed protein product [Protopolystoma xenopodis]|uniref:Uncharacterized protein n=1 Tax=Protopolystoma xenopodis TaxID=117903 RepID=A0A3S5A3Y7_9PLAT|nr:unnamed protein product [Protopolystoma xenopodis]
MSSLMGAGASNSPLNASTTSTSTGLGTQTLCGSGGNLGAMGALGSSTGLRNSVPTTSPQGGDSSSDCTGSSFVGSSGHFGHSNNYPSGSGGSESGTTTGGHSFYTTSQSVGAATAFPSALRPTGFRLRASSGNVGCSGGESTTNGGTDGYKSSHPPLHSSGQTSFGGPPIDLVTTPPAQQQLMSISNISTSPTRQVLSIPSPGGTIQAAALSASTPSQLCLQANSSIALPLINASKGNISINGGNDSSKTGSSGDILDSQLPSELVASSVGCPSQTDG